MQLAVRLSCSNDTDRENQSDTRRVTATRVVVFTGLFFDQTRFFRSQHWLACKKIKAWYTVKP